MVGAGAQSALAGAIRVFESRGFDRATVDEVAEAGGISRSTLFRRYGSKEGIVFADHEELLSRLGSHLGSTSLPPVQAICEAATQVFEHHVALGDLARRRFVLLRSVPALRDHEIVMIRRYETLFSRHLATAGFGDGDLREACAASVVAVHNLGLREWLTSEPGEPHPLPAQALRRRLSAIGLRFSQDLPTAQ